jgi:hypothetical protein
MKGAKLRYASKLISGILPKNLIKKLEISAAITDRMSAVITDA